MVSTAPTCGLTKGGRLLPLVDPKTGARVQVADPETGEPVDAVNDQLLSDIQALAAGEQTDTLRFIDRSKVSMRAAVPVYYDRRFEDAFRKAMETPTFQGFSGVTVGDLINKGILTVRGGHGSPSTDQRVGLVPYIKVSDLRAGLVNINPTNRVPQKIAEKHWRGAESGLRPFDLLCPERTSKNIGDFCLLLPGQERVLLTKEIIVLRPGPAANFDAFYLLWALTLKIVRDQWKRVVFMQTNREDVGKRYLELLIPVAETAQQARAVSEPFRTYYTTLAQSRAEFGQYLADSGMHHFFVSGAEPPDPEELAIALDEGDDEAADEAAPDDEVTD
jgi:hypothetical protein